jgi:tRNA A64-2'-O-ribosylphosphate transferase
MPDALSKTIPIWCAVVNSFLFPTECNKLYTPRNVVSESEHAQITALLPSFLESLRSLEISSIGLRSQITKPLRPMWITPESQLSAESQIFSNFHPIICCTISRRVSGGEVSEGGYIQGAGDDTENWAYGLTPSIYWRNQRTLLSTPENDVRALIESLVEAAADIKLGEGQIRCLKPTSLLYIAPLLAAFPPEEDPSCLIMILPKVTERDTWRISSSRLEVGLGPHKKGSRNLREALQTITDFANDFWSRTDFERGEGSDRPIMITCESGKDLSIGVALALTCLFFDGEGKLRRGDIRKPRIDKAFVRRRLGWISTSMPDANPSRSTLQSVNSFLMERP